MAVHFFQTLFPIPGHRMLRQIKVYGLISYGVEASLSTFWESPVWMDRPRSYIGQSRDEMMRHVQISATLELISLNS